jgi:hypothetical protein
MQLKQIQLIGWEENEQEVSRYEMVRVILERSGPWFKRFFGSSTQPEN